MKVGLQTLPWQECDDRLPQLFRDVKRLGYAGIEIAQMIPSSKHQLVAELLGTKGIGIELAGISGGAFLDRIELALSLSQVVPDKSFYLYADDWSDREHQQFMQSGLACSIAVHPHMFKPIQTVAEAKDILRSYSYTRLLPDTAHLTVAGDNIIEVLEANLSDVASIHIKDWTPEFGRALPFYSSGFVALGEGVVPIDTVVRLLSDKTYTGWLIVEQDFSVDPIETARKSRDFLRELGV